MGREILRRGRTLHVMSLIIRDPGSKMEIFYRSMFPYPNHNWKRSFVSYTNRHLTQKEMRFVIKLRTYGKKLTKKT